MVEIELNIYKKWNTVIPGFMYHQLMMPVFLLLTITDLLTRKMNQTSSLFLENKTIYPITLQKTVKKETR
jgi:hypothetical protein